MENNMTKGSPGKADCPVYDAGFYRKCVPAVL